MVTTVVVLGLGAVLGTELGTFIVLYVSIVTQNYDRRNLTVQLCHRHSIWNVNITLEKIVPYLSSKGLLCSVSCRSMW